MNKNLNGFEDDLFSDKNIFYQQCEAFSSIPIFNEE